MKKLFTCFLMLFMCSVGLADPWDTVFIDHPELKVEAVRLVNDYLKSQLDGDMGNTEKYGRVGSFYGVVDYKLLDDTKDFGVVYRVKATNAMGGVLWGNYGFTFSYDEKRQGYGGLRVYSMLEL